jgi:D-sedoheptulose 7-phosphate isomerase
MSVLSEKVSKTQYGVEQLYLTCSKQFDAAADLIEACFRNGGKLLVCGNGGSAATAARFGGELVGAYLNRARPALPAIALTDSTIITAVGNDFHYEQVFSHQVDALGRSGDVLIAISTSGESRNVILAATHARVHEVSPIVLTGSTSNHLSEMATTYGWPLLAVPAVDTPTVQELHLVVLHALAGEIERRMFG